MKRIIFLLLIVLSLHAQAQKGVELKVGPGFGFFGNDETWFKSALVSFSGLYNFNGVFAIEASYSIGLGGKTYYGSNDATSPTSFSELAGILQFTFLRTGKFKFYGNLSVAQIKGETETVTDQFGTVYPAATDSSVGIGGGAGIVMNIGSGWNFNILEYQLRSIKDDYLNMDTGFQGKAGSLNTLRTAVSYTFQGN